ncbi:S-methyl-5'-thioinosine phosphorylase [Silanimonas sp.]|jgi:5'-methylthioinosine phosphorylase|uniref:S-methyl-5'-thioinosine phosphorylase n=1 Tax=Silanimonas sp. TaxID=1929290 RepID=UPI0022BAD7F3|nr:S-methyl-5'-thioinosine phosphorylase [Silanimonas sp.]MCZ8061415.1 S-methyl-5'-thioinosine phosphorylase [Silanimonas sp.]MCZ8115098.1 S-methyl-5'-thioinosine phosphorylase [Silanimonas sp.]
MSRAIDFAVIGGTGLYKLAELEGVETHSVETPYGTPSAPVRIGGFGPHRIAFMARHGEGHAMPPHRINYRANLWALKSIGATRVVAVNSVGGITEAWGPRVIGVPDQIIDYTHGRTVSLWDGEGEALHVDFGDPYTPSLRRALVEAAKAAGVPVVDGGCYGATQGPRLETKAEIERLRRDGCDLVGMTGMPEAALARELGLDYACLAIVANWAAGRAPTDEVITLEDVLANMAAATEPLPGMLRALKA